MLTGAVLEGHELTRNAGCGGQSSEAVRVELSDPSSSTLALRLPFQTFILGRNRVLSSFPFLSGLAKSNYKENR